MSSSGGDRAVVIGGGVIGAACAYFLAKAGWRVTVLDAGRFGAGCSHANCGFICPSHVLPLTEPGAVWRAIKSLFQPRSPFRIKPRLDPRLWSWFWHFARRCNREDMITAGHARKPLLDSSMTLYEQLLAEERIDCEWERRGLLFVYASEAEFEAYAETDRLLREEFGVAAERLDRAQVRELEPALKEDIAGAWYYEHEAHLRSDKLMRAWRKVLERLNVDVWEGASLEEFRVSGSRATAAVTNGGEVPADLFVVATGAWTPLLATALGCRVPIQPGKGYSVSMPRPNRCPAISMIFPEYRVAVTPLKSLYRLGSIMEFAGYDSSIPPERLALLREAAERFLIEPYPKHVADHFFGPVMCAFTPDGEPGHAKAIQAQWCGWRPMTFDGIPIIDHLPGMENVWLAAGHNMLGMSMAPATGKLVCELISGRQPHIDPAPYRLQRFARRAAG